MKGIQRGMAFALAAVMAWGGAPAAVRAAAAAPVSAGEEFRAAWVSSVLNLDYPSKQGLTVEQLKAEADAIINRASEIGLNALILQVRPCSDALYKSDIFPWSVYLTGIQGAAPAGGFDPLAYWAERCHAKGIELHAWLNPYRVTHTAQKLTDVSKLDANHPARKQPARVISYKGALYYDPGLPENRKLIVDGAREILENYDVDGIHIDDYFYPAADFPDDASFKKYGGGMERGDWRRDNVNKLVQELQAAVHEAKAGAVFGVSPFAIWQNKSSSPLGSDTNGNESYKNMYADTRRWVKEGWVDYIVPEIYWYIGYKIADYEKLLYWWRDVCRDTGVKLYIGHAAYREGDGESGWSGETARQLRLNAATPGVGGSVFFRAKYLNGDLGRNIQAFYAGRETEPGVKMTQLKVNLPSGDVSTTASGYTLLGTCEADKPLYLNGKVVDIHTAEGFFSAYVKLERGVNKFTFTQAGQNDVTVSITSKAAAVASPKTMTAGVQSAFPGKQEYMTAGEAVTFTCVAPAGAAVKVKAFGQTVEMTTGTKAADGKAVYAATYTAKVNAPAAVNNLTNFDGPTYTAVYNGKTYTAQGARLTVIKQNAPFYATVTAEAAFVYPNATTDGGSDRQLVKGMRDFVTAVSKDGGWVRLSYGLWIEAGNVSYKLEDAPLVSVLSDSALERAGAVDRFVYPVTGVVPAAYGAYDGETLNVRFGLGVKASFGQTGRVEGYYYEVGDGSLAVCVKKAKALAEGDKPFSGFSFVIDAGHGGSDYGAIGPMGTQLSEKHLNLTNAGKLAARLEALGAKVTKTRAGDVFYSLNERTEISRKANPDLFISVHANSMDETVDASGIRGLSLWYRNALSKPLADTLLHGLYKVNPGTTRRELSNQSNFYVCRPSWCPSVIIETSFVCNAYDFSWLVNEREQDRMADGIVAALLEYYKR